MMNKILKSLLYCILFCTILTFSACDNDSPGNETLSQIAITSPAIKTIYKYGDEKLDTTGLVITATYLSSKTKIIPLDDPNLSITGFDSSKNVTQQIITILYHEGEKEDKIERYCQYQINYSNLSSIAVTQMPEKHIYHIGDELDLTGLVVTASYSDGLTQPITITKDNITGFDSSKNETSQTLTISYSEGKDEYTISRIAQFNITYSNLNSIAVTQLPEKKVYIKGDTLDLTGLQITATYNNGFSQNIPVAKLNITGFDSSKCEATQSIYINYSEGTGANEIKRVTSFSISYANLSSIAITRQPDKKIYRMTECLQTYPDIRNVPLDTTGLEVTINYTNGESRLSRPEDDLTITGFDPTNFNSTQTIDVIYKENDISRDTQFQVTFVYGETYKYTEFPINIGKSTIQGHNRERFKFGDYPQTKKQDSVKVDLTRNTTMGGIVQFLGSDGNYYAKGPVINNTFDYYKVEPVTWWCYPENGNIYLISEYGLISGIPYSYDGNPKKVVQLSETVKDGEKTKTIYTTKTYSHTDYRISTLRAWLTGNASGDSSDTAYNGKGFFQSAFTDKAAMCILPKVLTDSCHLYTMTVHSSDGKSTDEYNGYKTTNDLQDMVFTLPNTRDALGDPDMDIPLDKINPLVPRTDYAKAFITQKSYDENLHWYRTQSNSGEDNAVVFETDTTTCLKKFINSTDPSIVPVIRIGFNSFSQL